MEDLAKSASSSAPSAASGSTSQAKALELSFDQSAFDSLDVPAKKKRGSAAPKASEEPVAKRPKLQEMEGVDPVLLALQMKKNQARVVAKQATSEEEALQAAGPFAAKHKAAAEERKAQKEFKEKLEEAGVDPEFYARLHDTQESAEAAEKRKNRRGTEDTSSLGPSIDQYASSFTRRSKDATFDRSAYEAQKEALGDDFYEGGGDTDASAAHRPSRDRMDAMVAELSKQGGKRKDFSRRRTFKEEKDITFINEANRQFNKKLEKHYGKTTASVKESLERGTAL